MVRCDRFVMAVLAAAMVAAPASGALFEQNFDGVEDGTLLNSLGWSAMPEGGGIHNVRVTNEEITASTANSGWARMYNPFAGGAVNSGVIAFDFDIHATDMNTDAAIGFTGADGTNTTSDRALQVHSFPGGSEAWQCSAASSLVLTKGRVGGVGTNLCAGFDGSAHVRIQVDFDNLTDGEATVTTTFTPLAGQNGGAATTVSATYENAGGLGITGLWLAGAAGSDFTADNLLVTIPEPATLGLVGMGGLLMAIRRRRA